MLRLCRYMGLHGEKKRGKRKCKRPDLIALVVLRFSWGLCLSPLTYAVGNTSSDEQAVKKRKEENNGEKHHRQEPQGRA